MKNYTEEQILTAIKGCEGSIEAVAIELGCSYVTAKKYIDMFEGTKTAFELET
jgi:molybdenum-dependent DNA-binding transcriptional regulator ModE